MNLLTAAYAPVYRGLVFPLYEGVLRQRGIYSRYRAISTAPALGIEVLREQQRRKLNDLLVYCNERVPFYRDLFALHGIDPRGGHDVESLSRQGITTDKGIVRAAGESLLSSEFDMKALYDRATSGSTGTPVLFYSSRENWGLRMATKYRSEDWIGKPPGTPVTLIWGHKTDQRPKARLKNSLYWTLQNYLFLSAFDIGEDHLVEAVESIKGHGSRFIESYVTAVYLMAKTIAKHGLTPPQLDGIIVGAERLYDFQKEEIERSFGCPVFDRYGCTEVGNIASECRQREGLHINMDTLWVEVVDENDRPVLEKEGDIVITDLENRAMPLIRYRIGDRGIMTDVPCSCGRNFPMLRKVVGRVSDTLKTGDGQEIHDMYFVYRLVRTPGLVKFRVTQDSLTHIRLEVEHDGSTDRDATSRWICDALQDLERYHITHTLAFVDSIPLTRAGKMRFFVSELTAEPGRTEQAHR